MKDDWITPLSIPLMIVLALTNTIAHFVVLLIYALPFLALLACLCSSKEHDDAQSISQRLATRRHLRELGIRDPLEP